MNTDNFFLKNGYQSRTSAATVEEEPGDYWTKWRVNNAFKYQYYVYQYAAELVRKHEFKSVIDLGCGVPSKLAHFISPLCSDISIVDQATQEPFNKKHYPAFAFYPADLEKDNLEIDRRFDLVICSDVIEHLLDPSKLLLTIKRLMKSDGIAVISTPERDFERGEDCLSSPKPEHVREWNSLEFINFLEHSGFNVPKHFLFPKKKVPKLEWLLKSQFFPGVNNHRWSTCQTAICQKTK
ncbi:hypothetical protein SCG7109_AR_00110 [Chlamydiales bacterium SCGC AG-110-M15]|nr:hypothetical protein SCG7109_AR_00110 [Chlamydiales bacterium SCGC AG-110-M15]